MARFAAHSYPVMPPVMVGRDAELVAGAAWLTNALAGHGTLALVAGEAGIGKSRLTCALSELATARGFRLLRGLCGEHDRAYPFAPLLDAFRQQLRRAPVTDGVEALFGPDAAPFARLLPELALPGAAPLPPLPPLPPEAEKRRLFEAFVRVFARRAATAPLLVVLEDLHWADEATLDLLALLPRRLAEARVLVLGTARTDEPGSAVPHWRAGLTRAGLLHTLDLAPLAPGDVDRLIASTPRPPSPTAVAAIHAQGEGNPFFIEELLRAWAEANTDTRDAAPPPIPASVRDAVTHHLDALDAPTRAVAEAAAAIGQQFALGTLAAVMEAAPASLAPALRALVAAYLVTEGADDAFAFRHALTREAVYARLLAVERRRWHGQVAHALAAATAAGESVSAAELGYHYHAARAWEPAMRWCREAGEEALALAATTPAVTHATRALDAASALGVTVPALWYVRGEALRMQGKRARADADLTRAADAARDGDEDATLLRALVALGVMWAGADLPRGRAYYEDALALARAIGDTVTTARTLTRIAYALILNDQPLAAWPYVRQARAQAEAEGNTLEVAQTHVIAATLHYCTGDLVAAVAEAETALPGFAAAGNAVDKTFVEKTVALESALGVWGVMAHETYAPSIAHAERAWRIGRESGYLVTEAETLLNLGLAARAVGDYGATASYIARAGAMMREIDFPQLVPKAEVLSFGYLHDLFAFPQALRHATRAYAVSQQFRALQPIRNDAAFTVTALTDVGKHAEAAGLLAEMLPPDGRLIPTCCGIWDCAPPISRSPQATAPVRSLPLTACLHIRPTTPRVAPVPCLASPSRGGGHSSRWGEPTKPPPRSMQATPPRASVANARLSGQLPQPSARRMTRSATLPPQGSPLPRRRR